MRGVGVVSVALSLFVAGIAACGGGPAIPAMSGSRESGQSKLMDKTFAGANKCNAKAHDRPFVIEWDATDMSSFEARAANDVIFVKYVGCDLQVLDSCVDDSIHGKYGTYKPVEWTAGSLEKIDIADEGELYAKLPLGAAELGGRVSAGERFHMEYFVSGTKTATRAEIFRADLARNPGCRGATHFVYAYNLGAFALGSLKEIKGEVNGSIYGFGGGGKRSSSNNAEKKGGELSSCRGESAKEVQTCKVPIRLTLHPISDGDDPDIAAAKAPETPEATNLAGKVDKKLKMNAEAQAHWNAASERHNAGDGQACLHELDAHDKADPNPDQSSTNPRSYLSQMRAHCVMMSGQCDSGKLQLRKAMLAMNQWGPEQVDNIVDTMAGQYCRGGSMKPRDQLISASQTLQKGSTTKSDVATCAKAYATVKRLSATVKPRDTDDYAVTSAADLKHQASTAAMCFGRAGDCAQAWTVFGDSIYASIPNPRMAFKNLVPQCKNDN